MPLPTPPLFGPSSLHTFFPLTPHRTAPYRTVPHRTAETKRSEFPRFYFVSDPTLLEILSLGSDPPSVVPHFQSGLFDSLTNVTFDKVGAAGVVGAGGWVLLVWFSGCWLLGGCAGCFRFSGLLRWSAAASSTSGGISWQRM